MKTLTLNESRAPYNISLNDALLTDEVVILEKEGRPVAALIPMAEYDAFQAWREEEKSRQELEAEQAAIEREHLAFQRMLPELLKQYAGQIVAIHNGQVVEVGQDQIEVWERAREKLPGAPVYVQVVQPPKTYKMPHRKVIL